MPIGYGERMELRHLRYFVGVATDLNFTKAAQKLHVAQPALSRQIRQLEDELGVKLLERDHHRVALTGAGRAFLAEASALLKQSDQAIRIVQQSGKTGPVQLNVGYIWGLFHSMVPPVLECFRQRSPETAVHLFDLAPLAQAQAILERRLDAGFIGFAHEANTAGLEKRKVGVCTFVAALPKDHPAARKTVIPLASLANELFLGISEQTYPGASREVMDSCARAGFRPRILQMVERGYTILGLVAGKCGVALLPEPLKALPHSGIVFRPLAEPPVADLFIAWRCKNLEPPLLELLDIV
jgi:DNA-binding transcriptional LysR family regulator